MWTPGIWELVIILVIVLVIFGAGKLPSVGRSLGDAISEFKGSIKDDKKKNADSGASDAGSSPETSTSEAQARSGSENEENTP